MTLARLRILAIEDDVADGRLLRYAMQGEVDFHAQITIVRDLATALRTLEQWSFDLVLFDLNLPDSQGLDTLHALRAAAPEQAIVIITGTDDVELATEGIKAGALDFIVKGQMSGHFLVRALQYALERHRLEREVRAGQRRALRVNDEILSAVANELRTPLHVLAQYVGVLADDVDESGDVGRREIVDVLERNLERVMRLTDEMLVSTWTAPTPIQIRRQGLMVRELVEGLVGEALPTAALRGIRVETQVSGPPTVVPADKVRLRQAIGDLVRYAIEHGPSPGVVEVAVDIDPGAGALRVTVVDGIVTSKGRPDFETRVADAVADHGPVTALTLVGARRVVEAHGGTVDLEARGPRTATRLVVPIVDLRELLRPIAERLHRDRDEYSVIRFEIRLPGDTRDVDRRRDEIHFAAQRCMIPDLDLVLPLVSGDAHGTIHMTILAHAGAPSATTIAERVQIELQEEFHAESSAVEFTHRRLEWDGEASFESGLDGLVAQLADDCPWSARGDV